MNGFNLRETREISDVECYDLRDAVGFHHGDKARVVDLNADHAVGNQERFPGLVRRRVFAENLEEPFDLRKFIPRFFNRESKAVIDHWTSRHVPKLRHILKRYNQRF